MANINIILGLFSLSTISISLSKIVWKDTAALQALDDVTMTDKNEIMGQVTLSR